jgi:hypothetical protein
MSLPNIVLFSAGRRWYRNMPFGCFQSNDGWSITDMDLAEAENGADIAAQLEAASVQNYRKDEELADAVKERSGLPDHVRFGAYDGKVYAIRDVWRLTSGELVNEYAEDARLERCEYLNKAGQWKPCEEGCLYSEIEPYA